MALLSQTLASISWTEKAALDPAIVYALRVAERERQSREHIPIPFKVLMFKDTYFCTICPQIVQMIVPRLEGSWLREPVLFPV